MKLVLLLLLARPLLGQMTLEIDLTGEWRQQRGDDVAWARSEFDDSRWGSARLPQPGPYPQQPWLRRTIELPDWADRSQLALTLGPFREVYAVYVNGREIATVGSFATWAETELSQTRTHRIPAEALRSGLRQSYSDSKGPGR